MGVGQLATGFFLSLCWDSPASSPWGAPEGTTVIHKLVLDLLDFLTIWPIQVGLLNSEVEQGKQVSGKVKGGRTAVFKQAHYPIENPAEENELH